MPLAQTMSEVETLMRRGADHAARVARLLQEDRLAAAEEEMRAFCEQWERIFAEMEAETGNLPVTENVNNP